MNPVRAFNGPENRTLRPKQESAVLALSAGHSQDESARESGAGIEYI